ncbi:MAG TPA: hypothetical protein VMF69_21575 [Gemmataceae bacterium]|nr:hypothetical protein [Gemmataceae bacterium]
MLRWTVLACLVLGLAGCGAGKKDKANASKPGAGSEQSSPTYPWKRPPDDLPRPSLPPAKSGERDSF